MNWFLKTIQRIRKGEPNRSSLRSLLNFGLNELERQTGRTSLKSNPDVLQVEPSTHCNLACVSCGRRGAWAALAHRPAYMSRATFLKLQPFLRTARVVVLHGWGEPLLNPDFLWMASVCKSHGCRVDFHTNGLLLQRETGEGLVAAGVDRITISIDAATAGTYRIVRGGRFQTILENLEELHRIKRHRATPYPRITFKYALMRGNVDEVSRLVDLAVENRVEAIELHHLVVFPGQPELAGQSLFPSGDRDGSGFLAQADAQINQAVQRARRLGIFVDYPGLYASRKPRRQVCAYRVFNVLCDGSVSPCGAQKFVFGNVNLSGLRAIWNGPEYRQMRSAFARGPLPQVCERCPGRRNEPDTYLNPEMSYVADTLRARRWDLCAPE